MFRFPENLYTDVRIETVETTNISYKKLELQEIKVRSNKGAFVRLFDGQKWYYTSTTAIDEIQEAIDEMALMASPMEGIENHPIVAKFEVNKDKVIQYDEKSIMAVPVEDKQALLYKMTSAIEDPIIVNYKSFYTDTKITKEIITSKGSHIIFDKQMCGIAASFDLKDGEKTDRGSYSKAAIFFDEFLNLEEAVKEEVEKSVDFIKRAEPVEAGDYTVLFSPMTTGVFTHESFGHKSESDFMVGDETMKKEWALGKKIGLPLLSIVEDGTEVGNGYTLYDDEGTKGRKNYIIKEGELVGRLHSAETAAILEEPLTGNARAMNFEYEPIVRMTTTYIEKGDRPLKDILAEIDKGIYVENFNHGSGMSTFTIAPRRAYKIENGKITIPVKVSVVTGSVFEALENVDAVSEEFELWSFVGGGCGKMEQYPLPVGLGGPYMRVKNLKVQ